MTTFKPYDVVMIAQPDFSHYGEIMSFITPDETYMVRRVVGHPGTLEELPAEMIQQAYRKPRWVHYARVEGRGHFPVDMLRYDCASPLNFDPYTGKITDPEQWPEGGLIIAAAHNLKTPRWTSARWSSFLWSAVHVSTLPYVKGT